MFLTPSKLGDALIVAIVGLIGWHAYAQRQRGRWMLFDPLNFFWAGVLAVYVIQPVAYADTLISWHAPGVFERTLFWTLFGLAFVICGYETRWGQTWASVLSRPPARLASGRLELAAGFFLALGLAGYRVQFSSAGGMYAWLSQSRGGTDWTKVSGYMNLLEHFLPVGVILLLFDVHLHRVSAFVKVAVWALAASMLTWFIYLGTRSRTIMFTGLILMAVFLPRRRNPPIWLVLPIFGLLFAVVEFQGAYRGNFTDLSFNLDQIDKREAAELILPSRLGGKKEAKVEKVSSGVEFNCVMAVVELVPDKVDYNYGYCLLEFFTRPIPRSSWPEKPYPFYEAFTPIYEMADLSASWVEGPQKPILAGPSFTFVGHYFAIGGALGLALGGLLTGALLRTIRSYLDENPNNEGVLVLYPFIATIGFGEATGEPLFWIFTLPFVVIPLLIVLHLCGFKVPRERRRRVFPVARRERPIRA